MKKIIVATLACLLAFTGTAFASQAVSDEGSLLDLLAPVVNAVMSGNPGLAAALALVLASGVAARYAGRYVPWANTSAARALMVLVGAFGGAVATALTGGAAWSLSLAWTALGVAMSAAGAYSLIKALVVEPAVKRWPWLAPFAKVFEKPDPVAGAVAAGDAAVKANPAPGAEKVTGSFREVK